MRSEWERYCRAPDLNFDGAGILVLFASGRAQRVEITVNDDAYVLRSVVAKQSIVSRDPEPTLRTWLRNQQVSLVGFRIDERGRIVGESILLKAGLTAEEFQVVLRTVAVECDRFEYQLTWHDSE
jgi:Putative bacterial sensory transduction regulator